jgi:hypothetical protein
MGTEIREWEIHTAGLNCEYGDQALNVRRAKAMKKNCKSGIIISVSRDTVTSDHSI